MRLRSCVLFEVLNNFFFLFFHVQPKNGSFIPVGLWALKAQLPHSASTPTGTATSTWQLAPEGLSKAFKCGGSRKLAPSGRSIKPRSTQTSDLAIICTTHFHTPSCVSLLRVSADRRVQSLGSNTRPHKCSTYKLYNTHLTSLFLGISALLCSSFFRTIQSSSRPPPLLGASAAHQSTTSQLRNITMRFL